MKRKRKARARPGSGRVFRRKSRLTGKELPTWWISYYVRDTFGRPKERCHSARTTNYEMARRLLRKRLGEVAAGKVQPIEIERITVAQLLDTFQEHNKDHAIFIPRGHVETLKATLGHLRASDVRRKHLDDLVRHFREVGARPGNGPISAATCNRYMATLRRAFSLGREKFEGFESALTFPHTTETSRGKYISPPDFYAIVRQFQSDVKRDLAELAYLTGVREGQLRMTELANVDPHNWVLRWKPEQVKSRDAHVLPLVERALDIIQHRWQQRRPECRYLFHEHGKPLRPLRSAWDTACRKAGFPVGRKNGGYVFHNTRHSAVSNLVAAGVSDTVAMSISGHKTTSVFQRYAIRQESAQRAALERTAEHLRNLGTTCTVTSLRTDNQGALRTHRTDTPHISDPSRRKARG